MAWREQYTLKDGTVKFRIRYRPKGEKSKKSQRAGVSPRVARNIRLKIEDDLAGRAVGLQESRTVSELVNEYVANQEREFSKNTALKIKYVLKHFSAKFGNRSVQTLIPADIERLKTDMLLKKFKGHLQKKERQYTTTTVGIVLANIQACLGFAKKLGYTDQNVAEGVDGPPDRDIAKALNNAEVGRLKEACKTNPELLKIVEVALETGMRQGEIISLTKAQIESGHITVQRGKTKNRKAKKLPIPERLQNMLKSDREKVFEGWSKNRLEQAFDRATERAKLNMRFHDLKHTAITTMFDKGLVEHEICGITGNSPQSLRRYKHLEDRKIYERRNSINLYE